MTLIQKRIVALLGLLVLSTIILLLDLMLSRVPHSTYSNVYSAFGAGFAQFFFMPLTAVFGWPIGAWFWRKTAVAPDVLMRSLCYLCAACAWLASAFMAFGYLRTWFMPLP